MPLSFSSLCREVESPQPDLGSVTKHSDEKDKGTMDVSGAGKVFTFIVKPQQVARPQPAVETLCSHTRRQLQ